MIHCFVFSFWWWLFFRVCVCVCVCRGNIFFTLCKLLLNFKSICYSVINLQKPFISVLCCLFTISHVFHFWHSYTILHSYSENANYGTLKFFLGSSVPFLHLFSLILLCVCVEVKLLSRVRLFATPWTVVYQAPQSMGFSRQEYWSGVSFPSPGDLPDPGIKPRSPALQADALPSEPPGKPLCVLKVVFTFLVILSHLFIFSESEATFALLFADFWTY